MVLLGRKEEDIMDSAFLKRMAISNPTDWSRYADDPDGIINERGITREERRRQFQVSLAVGDPRRHAPRTFRPLFEETKRGETGVDSYADGARIRFLTRIRRGALLDLKVLQRQTECCINMLRTAALLALVSVRARAGVEALFRRRSA